MQPSEQNRSGRWYEGITRYQWIVLIIASLGWVFDVFEGQIFVTSMEEMVPALMPSDATSGDFGFINNMALCVFLLGGALGGVVFGMLSDRIGRTKTMMITILMYACFTGLTAFVQAPWQLIVLRFLVAMGVGGEWAVASALVAEVFPQRARAWSLGIFHASSVFGTYLAVLAGLFIVGNANLKTEEYPDLNWRLAFLVGVIPAVLTIWIRLQLREPERWVQAKMQAAQDATRRTGRIGELFHADWRRHTLIGVSLAAVGLATFWGVHIYGKNLMRATVERPYAEKLADISEDLVERDKPKQPVLKREIDDVLELMPGDDRDAKLARLKGGLLSLKHEELDVPSDVGDEEVVQLVLDDQFERIKAAEMLGVLLVTTGGGLGLVLFGPICEWIGRRGAFTAYHVGGLVTALGLFQLFPQAEPRTYGMLLPIFGFLTLGMHAGYAIYFPELFPTRLRGTGGGFCFNAGRIIAAPILFLSGWVQKGEFSLFGKTFYEMKPVTLEQSTAVVSLLFVIGMVVVWFGPETKGRDLPE